MIQIPEEYLTPKRQGRTALPLCFFGCPRPLSPTLMPRPLVRQRACRADPSFCAASEIDCGELVQRPSSGKRRVPASDENLDIRSLDLYSLCNFKRLSS